MYKGRFGWRALWVAMVLLALLVVLGLWPSRQARPVDGLYTGTLGSTPIVLQLDLSNPAKVSGRYFAKNALHDQRFAGTLEADQLLLEEHAEDRYTPSARMRLKKIPDGRWQGQWMSAEGRQTLLTLDPARVEPPQAEAQPVFAETYQASPYDFLRLQWLQLTAAEPVEYMGYSLQWWTEPTSKIKMFEVLSGYTPEERERINQHLRQRLWSEVASHFTCLAKVGADDSYHQASTSVTLLTPDIVSASFYIARRCGDETPDEGEQPVNLDAHSAQPLFLEDVLWVGQGPAINAHDRRRQADGHLPEAQAKAFDDYRSQVFAPWLVAQLQSLYPQPMLAPEEADRVCDFNNPGHWRNPAWYFTPQGLYLSPVYPEKLQWCGGVVWSVLPFSVLQQHPGKAELKLPEPSLYARP